MRTRTIRRYLMWTFQANVFVTVALITAAGSNANNHSKPTQVVSGAINERSHLEFDVVSIKPIENNAAYDAGIRIYPGGRVTFGGNTLKDLICIAFSLNYSQVSGGPDWTGKTHFRIDAKIPEGIEPPIDIRHSLIGVEDERIRQMLQALLIARFQLKFHIQRKTGTVYLLERKGKSLKLKPTLTVIGAEGAKDEEAAEADGRGGFSSIGGRVGAGFLIDDTSMPQLAQFLSSFIVHAPVKDKTGLVGHFDFRSKAILDESDITNGDSALLAALDEAGLRLQSSKGPIEMFIIDEAYGVIPN